MKIALSLELNKRLRERVNEWHNFTYEKQANFKSPEKRGKDIKAQAYNCLCACMDRIDELVEHCNTLDLNTLFGLYDIFNYGQTLIDCIDMISKIYSEWARIQLKIIEPCFKNEIEFDYLLDDWYLHWQIEIAFWRMSKKK